MRVVQAALFVFILRTTSAIRCAPNSHFNSTASGCPVTCANKDFPRPCPIGCIPRCECNPGFVLDFRGRCIRECDCPKRCAPNSHFNPLAPGCQRTCENKDSRIMCSKGPVPRCQCNPGFVLNKRGVCIRECDCPKCGPDSHFRYLAPACPRTCGNYKNPKPCAMAPIPRCVCNPDYVLNHQGKCIKESDCPECAANSYFDPMASSCPRTCSNKDTNEPCSIPRAPRCVCRPGFVLDYLGTCIKECDCPSCPSGAVFDPAAPGCPKTCDNKDLNVTCDKPSAPGCVCREGFILNQRGVCIKECDCPKCPPFSRYNYTASACPINCENKDFPAPCTLPCKARCECIAGYVLDIKGDCIPEADCPSCKENMRYSFCASACDKTCENKDSGMKCTLQCVPKCTCLPGFVLDHNEKCIKECDCQKCPANASFKFKASACPATCENPTAPSNCSQDPLPQCECNEGFVLNSNGVCIPLPECPQCEANSVYKFKTTACPGTCENPDSPNQCTKGYIPGCECVPGFVLDINGKCTDQCPKCEANAVYKFKISACPATCENPDSPNQCRKGFTSGCECTDGYMLDINGQCVSKCPECQPNAVYKFKVSACPATCENPNCPKDCEKPPVPGCECRPGYILDVNGVCVAKCPMCQPNSVYKFKTSACPATCECPDPVNCTKGFIPACVCLPGFVLDTNGICIPLAKCPTCPPNSKYKFKASACPATCELPNIKCTLGFKPRCECNPGFVLNHAQVCIPLEECPKCPTNSGFRFNATSCIVTCENRNLPKLCTLPPKARCECNPGFVVDNKGNCILTAACPKCPPNSIFRFKASGCPLTCETTVAPRRCLLPFKPACECRPGFVLDPKNRCIPPAACPKCPPNSVFRFKASGCPLTCEVRVPGRCLLPFKPACECRPGFVRDVTRRCIPVAACPRCPPHSVFRLKASGCPLTCETRVGPGARCLVPFKPACVCLPGFVRDPNGRCIPPAACPKCPPNSVFRFKASGCPLSCETRIAPRVCALPLRPACQCVPGFVLDRIGRCIPAAACPKCPPNSVFRFKASGCPLTCETKNAPGLCALPFKPACQCLPGFVLDPNGRCIPAAACPKCPPNSVFRFKASGCPLTCETKNAPGLCALPFKPACQCVPGFVLDPNGRCIPAAACPKCPPNSVFRFKASGCPLTCETKNAPGLCALPFKPACQCVPGFVLDPNGRCIPAAACPRCPPNAFFKFNATACMVTCENKDSPRFCNLGFRPRCVCRPGFVRDHNGNCILAAACPRCPPFSSFRFNASACVRTCENINVLQSCHLGFKPRCQCNPGYVLDHTGNCIPVAACPKCPPDSFFKFNATACLRTCENKDVPRFCNLGFRPRCICRPGFVRDQNGNCILATLCPKCPPNSHFRFKATACLTTCENKDLPKQCLLGVKPRCICDPGFVLDHNGICILAASCPRCPPNSYFQFKASACVVTCENKDRSKVCNLGFKPRCVCKPGFVIDQNGICIPATSCPRCPPNSVFQYRASACLITCENKDRPKVCNLGFKPRCVCQPGFVLDHNGICIPVASCPSCPPNSFFQFKASACVMTCENKDTPKVCNLGFKPRCVCQPGFVIGPQGICIPAASCPRCPPNSIFHLKASACVITCENKDRPKVCNLGFKPRCVCQPGFVIGPQGICIPAASCPRCPPNSIFQFKASACVITCENKDRPKVCNLGFKPRCVCQPGFVIGPQGVCIPAASCPRCPPNSIFHLKASACVITCENEDRPKVCNLGFKPRCVCKPGFVIGPQGLCIPAASCPRCPPNSIFQFKASACLITCENKDRPKVCKLGFKPRCVCKPGFVIGPQGICIPAASCPRCPPNSIFQFKASACPITCENKDRPKVCNLGFKPRCVCKPGFVIGPQGICIPAASCPRCPPNSIFQFKASACPITCENKDRPKVCNLGFKPRCVCQPGFVIGPQGICIPAASCPRCPPNSFFQFKASACVLTCENKDRPKVCKLGFKPRCVCKPGFVVGPQGICIPAASCPRCPPNSIFQIKASACVTTCENKDRPKICNLGFKPRCVCKPGFVIGPQGICIPAVSCPRCPPNSVFQYKASACLITCENKDRPKVCTLGFKPRCVCRPGFVIGLKGECILAAACPKCPPNSSFRFKASTCPLTCENRDDPKPAKLEFKPRCQCNPGFVLNHIGNCIPIASCPRCAPNSHYRVNASACLVTCENIDGPKLCSLGLKPRCICKPGFVLNHEGNCILAASCPKCPPNSSFKFKAPGCFLNCENRASPIRCVAPPRPRCLCNPGFVLDPNGICILAGSCPTCPPNSVFRYNATACPVTCCNKDTPAPCALGFKPRCQCIPGFVLDHNNVCIPIYNCPKCPANSHFQPNASACLKTCEDIDCLKPCKLGNKARCECNPGFVADVNGVCIPASKCPRCGPNAHYTFCGSACPKNCENIDMNIPCTKQCVPRCVCDKGHVLNYQGICIPVAQCPKCGPNSRYNPVASACTRTCVNKNDRRPCMSGVKPSCECIKGYVLDNKGNCIKECDCPNCPPYTHFNETASGCPRTCANMQSQSECTVPCKPRCECDAGFVLNAMGKCIKECDCPKCGSNSHFNPAASACPITCANKDRPVPCRLGLVGRCQCNRGYVLNNKGKCVLECDCPVEGCPPNSHYNASASACRITCKNKDNPRPCNLASEPRCQCDDGYVLNHDFCIPEYKCIPKCGPHEHYSRCAPVLPLTCANRKTYPKRKGHCIARCVCNKGYFLNKHHHCVREFECQDCGRHMHFTECMSNCPRTCSNLRDSRICSMDCKKSGCACNEGYVSDNHGSCVKESECPIPRCGNNAHYTHQLADKPPTCADMRRGKGIYLSYSSVGRCQCKMGYYIDDYSNCVLASDCPL